MKIRKKYKNLTNDLEKFNVGFHNFIYLTRLLNYCIQEYISGGNCLIDESNYETRNALCSLNDIVNMKLKKLKVNMERISSKYVN